MANDLIDDIIDDLKTYSNNIAKFAAIEVRDQMAKSAHDAIEKFYKEKKFQGTSEPFWYHRNYYNFRKNSYKKVYRQHGKYYRGGITLTPENMKELYIHPTTTPWAKNPTWGAPAELVFEKVMEEGWHGPASRSGKMIEPMSPSPVELIEKRYDQLCRSRHITDKAEEKARKLSKYL